MLEIWHTYETFETTRVYYLAVRNLQGKSGVGLDMLLPMMLIGLHFWFYEHQKCTSETDREIGIIENALSSQTFLPPDA